jgi:hypothetical protein
MNRTRSIDLPRTHVWLLPVAVPALALLFLLWTSVPAAAHFLNHHDRNDSEDSLDLRAIHLWEYPQEGLFSLVVRTYDQIEGRGRSSSTGTVWSSRSRGSASVQARARFVRPR